MALTSLAAMVPEHEVRILDMRLEPEHVLNQVLLELEKRRASGAELWARWARRLSTFCRPL